MYIYIAHIYIYIMYYISMFLFFSWETPVKLVAPSEICASHFRARHWAALGAVTRSREAMKTSWYSNGTLIFSGSCFAWQLKALGSLPKEAPGWFGAAFREGSGSFRASGIPPLHICFREFHFGLF